MFQKKKKKNIFLLSSPSSNLGGLKATVLVEEVLDVSALRKKVMDKAIAPAVEAVDLAAGGA